MNQDVAVVVNDESISTNTQLKSDSQLKFHQITNFKRLTRNGCISFLMSDTGMSAPATPNKCAIRVLENYETKSKTSASENQVQSKCKVANVKSSTMVRVI